jgi:uncharacterized protein (AIM24 family)
MQYTVHGELAQVAKLMLEEGETCWASKGSIVAMDPGLSWTLKVPGGASGAARRMMSGEGIALTFIAATADGQRATLAANQPGKIIVWNLDDGPVITTRGSFVSAFGPRVDIDVRVAKRAGAAFFGGAGLFLQHISGWCRPAASRPLPSRSTTTSRAWPVAGEWPSAVRGSS